MRKPLIAGNWKMNKKTQETIDFVKGLKQNFEGYDGCDILVIPPYTALYPASEWLKSTQILLGAQNFYPEREGAFTGEISYTQLLDLQCRYVLIGHSERRQIFQESNEFINCKVKIAIDKGLSPILCIGETLSEREEGKTREVLTMQVNEGLKGVATELGRFMTIAYEPVWAIGTGRVAQNEDIQETHAFIRGLIFDNFDGDIANHVRILYGGSVKPENIYGIMQQRDVDGVLVGGASLNLESFSQIIRFGENLIGK